MPVSTFHGMSIPILLFFAALFFAIFIFPQLRRKSTSKRRTAVLQSMGYVQCTREQVFDNPKLLARLILDRQVASISDWVGKGQSAFGETVIFDFTFDITDAATPMMFTVVAFRVAQAIPEFEISHVLLLERMLHLQNDADVSAPHMGTYDRHAHRWSHPEADVLVLKRVDFDENPAFAKNYRVWSSDADAMRRVLTRAMIDALVSADDSNLHVTKRGEWLMIYRWISSTTPPDGFPALVQHASQLATHLDLDPGAGG